jgi:nucleoside-diphosphate-sugar epimerase
MKLLITGANGFIGRALCAYLSDKNIEVTPVVRRPSDLVESIVLSDVDEDSWAKALQGCDTVVHLAGQAQIKTNDENALLALHQSNVELAVMVLKRAIQAGVGRFVFLSTAKVHGEKSKIGKSFTTEDTFAPQDPYAKSKCEAEQKLMHMAKDANIELVIIRPPVVYGKGVKGNFASLIKCVQNGVPLPLAGAKNLRSMVAVENLSSFIAHCSDRTLSPKAANQVFFVTDGNPVTTADLLKLIASANGTKARIFYIPMRLMGFGLWLIGKSAIADRLFGSFVLNDKKCQELLCWNPPVAMTEQLQRMSVAKTD